MGRVSDGECGVGHLESAMTDDSFQADGKTPVANDELARCAICSARVEEASLSTDSGKPSGPVLEELHLAIVAITSDAVTCSKENVGVV
uniref:Uncharacterized protein n=1 Tax=Trichogramma kaykai TaxID=54128 RepID=A0ABD2X0P1_9HYME